MSENKNKRGSEWRKWDLHVHTPFTKMANNFTLTNEDALISTSEEDKKWEKYFLNLKNNNIKVAGITDYFLFRTSTKNDF